MRPSALLPFQQSVGPTEARIWRTNEVWFSLRAYLQLPFLFSWQNWHFTAYLWADQPVPDSPVVLIHDKFRPVNGTEAFEETGLWKKNSWQWRAFEWTIVKLESVSFDSSKVWAMVDSTTGAAKHKQSTSTSVGASSTGCAASAASFVSVSSWLKWGLLSLKLST